MREAGAHHVTVKGGKYLELISEADTVVFDKTGTLTRSIPRVERVVAMTGRDEDKMLALAAELEAHFPHSLANAVVRAAAERGVTYGVPHSKPEYIVAHGIVSMAGGERVVIGSWHFVFEDEKTEILPEDEDKLHELPPQYSHLYMAIDGRLAAIIGIDDPIKTETPDVIRRLRQAGLTNIVMMTGDSERTAAAIAAQAGVDRYYSEVLPEDKARYVEQEKAAGHKVIMIGDGINDSPALSAADVGIAMKEGADIAREIADITLSGSELEQLVALKELSDRLMVRMKNTGHLGVAFNGAILAAGILGLVTPGTAALLHNTSTIGLCLRNMRDMVPSEEHYRAAVRQ
jgi:cation transport ATPase